MLKDILAAMPYSLVGYKGLVATYKIVDQIERNKVEGSIVECGVAQGGCSAMMALLSARYESGRFSWLFDSYEGMPETTNEDYIDGATGSHARPLPPGSCLGTIEQVEELLFDKFNLEKKKINLVKGWFEDTLHLNVEDIGQISFLRIDADWYAPVKCCLENFFDSVVSGGTILIDDYTVCHGAKKATDEFLAERSLSPTFTPDTRGGIFFTKP